MTKVAVWKALKVILVRNCYILLRYTSVRWGTAPFAGLQDLNLGVRHAVPAGHTACWAGGWVGGVPGIKYFRRWDRGREGERGDTEEGKKKKMPFLLGSEKPE